MGIERRTEGTRWLGIALLGIAAWFARGVVARPVASPTPASTSSAVERAPLRPTPRPVAPIGTVTGRLPAFRWDWQGPEPARGFEVVLLDDAFLEVWRSDPTGGRRLDPTTSGLAARLQVGVRFHWCVQLAGEPATCSAPMPLRRT